MEPDPPKVLIVDDNGSLASALAERFRRDGLDCTFATDSMQAMTMLRELQFGVALVDLHMPGLNGIDLLRNVKTIDQDIQVIIMTALPELRSGVAALKLGALDYVSKDRPAEELLGLIRKGLRRREEALRARTQHLVLEQQVGLRASELEARNAQLEELLLSVIRSMALALEARDPYTRGHSERVAIHSVAIAERLMLPAQQIPRIQLAGLLHDIGKIGVREDVLMKAGKLTEEEYNNMKSHAVTGATILRPIAQFEDIIDCVMYHHERLDGSGYPEGLRGDAIPLGAKILAVADAFDAMTSDRAYRPARPARAAVEELIRCKGVQFEPVVVDAFVEVIQTLQPAAV